MRQEEMVRVLMAQAAAALNDRRDKQRHPFFRPVTVCILGLDGVSIEGFSRDISETGLGLLTLIPLPTVKVSLGLEEPDGDTFRIVGDVVWTEPCGKGWYTSGINFCYL
jgi:hypothetical protein